MTPPGPSSAALQTRVDVVVDDGCPVDAALVPGGRGEKAVLVLRTWQSFDNAVEQVTALLPGEHPDAIRALVRANLKNALDFDRLSAEELAPSWVIGSAAPPKARSPLARKLVWCIAGLVVAVVALGYSTAREALDDADLIGSTDFQQFAAAAGLSCVAQDTDDADCRNEKAGTIVVVSARQGGHGKPTRYWLRQADHLTSVIVFDDAEAVKAWPDRAASARLWPYMRVVGRYAVVSTDLDDLTEYARVLNGIQLAPAT